MALTHGMNVEDVKALGRELQAKKGEIEGLIGQIEARVSGTAWEGPDAQTFKGTWWPQHKASLQQIGEALHGFGQSAINNAAEQEDVSSR